MKKLHLLLAATVILFADRTQAQSADGFRPLITEINPGDYYIFLGRGTLPANTNQVVQIEDRTIRMYPGQPNGSAQVFGYISTVQEYSNYHLRFEYKWGTNRFGSRKDAKRDAGVIYHMFGKDNVWPSGVECQVQETDTGDIFTVNARITTTVDPATTNLATIHTTNATTKKVTTTQAIQPLFLEPEKGGVPFVQGAASGIKRVLRNPMNEREGWNTVEVIVRGADATHILNGKVNNRVSRMERFVDDKWVPLTRGKIIFQLEGAEVSYRNIEIKELKP